MMFLYVLMSLKLSLLVERCRGLHYVATDTTTIEDMLHCVQNEWYELAVASKNSPPCLHLFIYISVLRPVLRSVF